MTAGAGYPTRGEVGGDGFETWAFTFGGDHRHPYTGEPLRHCYVRVRGDAESTRMKMLSVFGQGWSMQRPTPEAPIRRGMREIPFPGGAAE